MSSKNSDMKIQIELQKAYAAQLAALASIANSPAYENSVSVRSEVDNAIRKVSSQCTQF